jgi:hypothetical protein
MGQVDTPAAVPAGKEHTVSAAREAGVTAGSFRMLWRREMWLADARNCIALVAVRTCRLNSHVILIQNFGAMEAQFPYFADFYFKI